jgi:hypothetical protein
MADNLRRSLVPTALLLLLVGSWTVAPELSGLAVVTALLALGWPTFWGIRMELLADLPNGRGIGMRGMLERLAPDRPVGIDPGVPAP